MCEISFPDPCVLWDLTRVKDSDGSFCHFFIFFFFQLFREVRIMKTLNHPNIGELHPRELSSVYLKVIMCCVCVCFHADLCANTSSSVCYSAVVWGDWDRKDSLPDYGVRQWRWVTPPPPPSSLPSVEWCQLDSLLWLNYTVLLMNSLI